MNPKMKRKSHPVFTYLSGTSQVWSIFKSLLSFRSFIQYSKETLTAYLQPFKVKYCTNHNFFLALFIFSFMLNLSHPTISMHILHTVSVHFLRCWQGGFIWQSKVSLVQIGYNFLSSRYLNISFMGDIVRRNLMLPTLKV